MEKRGISRCNVAGGKSLEANDVVVAKVASRKERGVGSREALEFMMVEAIRGVRDKERGHQCRRYRKRNYGYGNEKMF